MANFSKPITDSNVRALLDSYYAKITNTVIVNPPSGDTSGATDLAAINAAITTLGSNTGVVLLQGGTYIVPAPSNTVNGSISFGSNGSVLAGAGMDTTTIQLAAGTLGVTGIVRTPSGVQNSNITFRDFTIDGNNAAQTGSPLVIGFYCGVTPNSTLTDTDISMLNVRIKNCSGYGFDPHERTTRLKLIGCIAQANGLDGAHDGFTLDAQYGAELIGCYAIGNGRHGFNLVTASSGVKLTSCSAIGNGGNGFTIQNGSKNNIFDACISESNTGDGILVNGVAQTGSQQDLTVGTNNAVKNCTVRSSGAHGIHIVAAPSTTVTANTIRDPGAVTVNSNGIYLDESGTAYTTDCMVSGNDVGLTSGLTSSMKYGIFEKTTNEDRNFIVANRVAGATTKNVLAQGATSAQWAAHNGSNEHPTTSPYSFDSPVAHGLLEWNFAPASAGSTSSPTAGKVYLERIVVQTGGTFTNIVLALSAAGVGLANCYVGLFSSSGAQLAVSADCSTALQSSGTVSVALTTPLTGVAAGTVVLVALLIGNASTTSPTLYRGASGAGPRNFGLTTASPLCVSNYSSGLTAMPASITLASTTAASSVDYWCAIN